MTDTTARPDDEHGQDPTRSAPEDPSEAMTMDGGASAASRPTGGEPAALLAPGQRFGPYRIVRLLGRGGMGEVYEAEEDAIGRRVALKLFNRPIGDPRERERFLREGQLAAAVSHPNSIYIFGSDEIKGTPVIAMELASGGTLKDVVKARGPLPALEAVGMILHIVAGLEAAAAVGVLHRDIKPANCFVDRDGGVKVGDFGLSISTLARDETHLTMVGTVLGTPAFASPEQMQGDALDVRSDIYSVGATLYFLLTGRAPFEEANVLKLMGRVLKEVPPSPRAINPAVPKGTAAAVMRCLEKQPADRPQTYAELRRVLLPFGSLSPAPATRGLRLLAGVIDSLVCAVLFAPGTIEAIRIGNEVSRGQVVLPSGTHLWMLTLIGLLVSVVYYTVLEGLWGMGAGKAMLGLRVVDAHRQIPGVRAALVRAGTYAVVQGAAQIVLFLAVGGPAAYYATLAKPDAPLWLNLADTIGPFIGVVALFSTARRANGFAGLHDLVSGTRVISKTTVEAARPARAAHGAEERSLPALGSAQLVGPYRCLDGAAGPSADVRVAHDPQLRRNVWIHFPAPGTPALPAARRDLARPARLRWLTGHRADTGCWDAFEAVEGQTFAAAVRRPQSWDVVRRWLRDLAEELEAALKDGTAPALSTDAVWVGTDGRARLLDWTAHVASADLGAVQDFLLVLARSALAGQVATSPTDAGSLTTGPVALSAGRFLTDLAARAFTSPRALSDAAGRLVTGRSQVSRGMRVTHLAVTALVPLIIASAVLGFAWSDWNHAEVDAWLRVLEKGRLAGSDGLSPQSHEAIDVYVAAMLQRDPGGFNARRYQRLVTHIRDAHPHVPTEELQRATAVLAKLAIPSERLVAAEERRVIAAASIAPLFTWSCAAVLATVGSVAARGGLLLSLFGIAIVRKDGARASRWRCLCRAVTAWSPVVAGTAVGFVCLVVMRANDPLGARGIGVLAPRIFVTAALIAGGVFIAGAVYAALRPERGWQDRIMGTYLVPK